MNKNFIRPQPERHSTIVLYKFGACIREKKGIIVNAGLSKLLCYICISNMNAGLSKLLRYKCISNMNAGLSKLLRYKCISNMNVGLSMLLRYRCISDVNAGISKLLTFIATVRGLALIRDEVWQRLRKVSLCKSSSVIPKSRYAALVL